VFEATKRVADKIRSRSGYVSDGSTLVDEAFAFRGRTPDLGVNSLQSPTEQSDQPAS